MSIDRGWVTGEWSDSETDTEPVLRLGESERTQASLHEQVHAIHYAAQRPNQTSRRRQQRTRRRVPYQELALAKLRTNMVGDYESSLARVLDTFRNDMNSIFHISTQRMQHELLTFQNTFDRRVESQAAIVERNLSVAFDRKLPWDWLPDDEVYYDIGVFLDKRQLRYRGDPQFIVSASQYYLTYRPSSVDILQDIGTVGGFYVPAVTSHLFLTMGKEVVEGSKELIHVTHLHKCGIPDDQIDLAWSAEATKGLEDLLPFIPGGFPVSQSDKEFYLDIANTLRGSLLYQPVQELTSEEILLQQQFHQQIVEFTDKLGKIKAKQSLNLGLQMRMWGEWDLDVTSFRTEYEEMKRKLEEKQMESEPERRSCEVEGRRTDCFPTTTSIHL